MLRFNRYISTVVGCTPAADDPYAHVDIHRLNTVAYLNVAIVIVFGPNLARCRYGVFTIEYQIVRYAVDLRTIGVFVKHKQANLAFIAARVSGCPGILYPGDVAVLRTIFSRHHLDVDRCLEITGTVVFNRYRSIPKVIRLCRITQLKTYGQYQFPAVF